MDGIRQASAQALRLEPSDVSVESLSPRKNVADDAAKYLVVDRSGRPLAVTLVSAAVAPNNVRRAMACAREAREFLGASDLGQPILEPLAEGSLGEVSYAVLPYCRPLSALRLVAAWQRAFLGPQVLQWLRDTAARSLRRPTPGELAARFQHPLRSLVEFPSLPERLRSAGRRALQELEAGTWQPRLVLMHGDFWWGNILLDTRSEDGQAKRRRRFAVIDWQGLLVDGYGFFDLVRFDRSMPVGKRLLLRELDWHCQALECPPPQVANYIVAAHAWIALHLEHFPVQRFIEMFSGSLAHATATAGALTRRSASG